MNPSTKRVKISFWWHRCHLIVNETLTSGVNPSQWWDFSHKWSNKITFRNGFGTCPRLARDVCGTCPRLARDLPGTCLGLARALFFQRFIYIYILFFKMFFLIAKLYFCRGQSLGQFARPFARTFARASFSPPNSATHKRRPTVFSGTSK